MPKKKFSDEQIAFAFRVGSCSVIVQLSPCEPQRDAEISGTVKR